MTESLKDRVARRLNAMEIGAITAATSVGLERTYIRDIVTGKKKSVSTDKLSALARALQTTVEYLTFATDDPTIAPGPERMPETADTVVSNADLSKTQDLPGFRGFGGPRDVPEYGIAVGGRRGDADFQFNGKTVDWAPRPPGILHKKDVYSLRVGGDSMYPKYEDGERLYVDPHRSPAIKDYVVIELRSGEDGEPGDGFIKRLVRRTATRIIVEQFNPPMEIEFDREEVKSLHRVIPTEELLGI